MHPQLTDKTRACKELIENLELCHSDVWAKYTGGCNDTKLKLNLCLRSERLERTARNSEKAKEMRVRRQEAMKELHEND
ncbi:UPF0287-domain-containing protein [Schizopora paradoxa]|uniref:COX assembly mitochondrial protein n=1 Tax=Schizopora paradoxa TaxID=27342 RepID=A0A0H2S3K2_9AGAM|nr:UPF0287-domain-containing protein [Schizopora paradoxa]